MSILRGLGKFFGGAIFTFFLISSITVGAFAQLLEYNNLKPIMIDLVNEQFPKQELSLAASELRTQCMQRDSVQFSFGTNQFSFDCKNLKNSTDESISEDMTTTIFNGIYFRNYGCEFVECMQQPGSERILVLFSATAYKFFSDVQFALWSGIILGSVIMIASIETWEGRLKAFGISLTFTGLPFLFFNYLRNFIFSMFGSMPANIMQVMDKIFGTMSTNYLIILILGLSLTVASYVMTVATRKDGRKV